MEDETQSYDVDIEDGELSASSEDGYTPLQRPSTLKIPADEGNTIVGATKSATDEEDDDDKEEDSDSSGPITQNKNTGKKHKIKRTMMVRLPATDTNQRARFKKYNVWTAALQEDTLTEDLRCFDVNTNRVNDRNVENYDFLLHSRLNGENSLKRRFSRSSDDNTSENEERGFTAKRGRLACDVEMKKKRTSVKSRLGYRAKSFKYQESSHTSESSTHSDEPRYIADLTENISGLEIVEAAREIADKLCEDKDDLLVRIVEVVGTEIPVNIFKETQRIEADGGMLVKNGIRRRTPGGVFLFLLKNDERITEEQKKLIFSEDRQIENRRRKTQQSLSWDRKVQELKKRLNEQKTELPRLNTRSEMLLLGHDLNMKHKEVIAHVSNPPPSPVGNEASPEYKTQSLIAEKPHTINLANKQQPITYGDDILNLNNNDMDLF